MIDTPDPHLKTKVLGIDYGDKKIGLAIGINGIVEPLKILENRPDHLLEKEVLKEIIGISQREKVQTIVIGLPLLNGKETPSSKKIRNFSEKLNLMLPEDLEIKYVDESRTSKDSLEKAIEAGIPRKKRKDDHALAACEILKRFFVGS